MSTRQLLTPTTGVLTVLTVAALVAVGVTWSPEAGDAGAVAVTVHQQELVADMNRQLDELVAAEDFQAVNAARGALGRTVVAFDRTLNALVHGGGAVGGDGRTVHLHAVQNKDGRRALSAASALWLQVGMPLADLAGGDYSVFSAAGQRALKELRESTPELTANLAAAAAACDGRTAGPDRAAMVARLLAGACLLALAGAVALRRRAARPAAQDDDAAADHGLAPAGAVSRYSARRSAAQPAPAPRSELPPLPYKSPVDFEDVSAAVDQLTVDMSTVATSTEKMRTAIDSVGVALQGMLYRLNDLGDDTAEGYRLVRGANNAAGFTAQVAAELAESVREMAGVVSRVNQLAQKSRHTAAAIDQEAEQTGRTGAAFTDAVSGQVKTWPPRPLTPPPRSSTPSPRCSRARASTRRRWRRSSSHVSAIHKVSQNLGQVVLDPPASAVVGPPRPRTRVLEPAAGPARHRIRGHRRTGARSGPGRLPPIVDEADEAPEPTPAEVAEGPPPPSRTQPPPRPPWSPRRWPNPRPCPPSRPRTRCPRTPSPR